MRISISVCHITVKISLFYILCYRYSNNLNESCNLLAYCNSFKYKDSDNHSEDSEDAAATNSDDNSEDNEGAAAIRANHPIPSQCKLFYFEVEIIDKGKRGSVRFFNFYFVLHRSIFLIFAHDFFDSIFQKGDWSRILYKNS